MFPRSPKSQPVSSRTEVARPGPYRTPPPPPSPDSGQAAVTGVQQLQRTILDIELQRSVQLSQQQNQANAERYALAMRQHDPRLARQDTTDPYAAHLRRSRSPAEQTLVNQARARAYQQRYGTAVRADTRTAEQRLVDQQESDLRRHYEQLAVLSPATALTARHDPVVRAVASAVVLVLAAEHAGAWAWRRITLQSFFTKVGVSATGQFLGNYLYTHDAAQSAAKINGLSALASGVNMPLGLNSMWSAGFSYSYADHFKSLPTGQITPFEFGRDAAFNYGFGKVSAGFKLPNANAKPWLGLDNLHSTVPMSNAIGAATYQSMLRLGPRFGYNLGLGLTTAAEHGNKVATGAVKKYLNTELKEKVVDPNK